MRAASLPIRLCTECGTSMATRICQQCDDDFCDACFPRMHKTGAMLRHTCQLTVPMCAHETCGKYAARVDVGGGAIRCYDCYEHYHAGAPCNDTG